MSARNLSRRVCFFLPAYSASAKLPCRCIDPPLPEPGRFYPIHHPKRDYFSISLVEHPLSCCGIWQGGDPGAARGAVPPPATPEEGVLVLVPVRSGAPDGLFDLCPSLEAAPFEGQRAQDLPPRLDQVQVGRILWLEDELPARVGQ